MTSPRPSPRPRHGAGPTPATAPPSRWARHLPTALVALLCAALGLALVTQVRDTGSGDALDNARAADLVVLLDTLQQREADLREEIAALQDSAATLRSAGAGSEEALTEARQRAEDLAVLVGTVAATGPGLRLVTTDPDGAVGPEVLLDEIQELRAAGVEAMQVTGQGGAPVRVGLDTAIGGSPGRLTVDGVPVPAPVEVLAIGDPSTLAAALNIPGGVVDTVARAGGELTITQLDVVEVTALRVPREPQYARPR